MKQFTLTPEIQLYKWQAQCLEIWVQNQCHGTVDVVTGAGKTIFAIAALCRCSRMSFRPVRVRIVLPKHALIRQWINALRASVKENLKIGEWHGKRKDSPNCDVMIYIVNSARHAISSHIIKDQEEGYSTFLIADECHHYCRGENLKIFHFIHSKAFSFQYFYSIGLSATLDEALISEEMRSALGNKIYSYGVNHALTDKHISPFALFKIQIALNTGENIQYSMVENKIAGLISLIRKEYPLLTEVPISEMLISLRSLSPDAKELAKELDELLRRKQAIIIMAKSRIPCALKIIEEISSDSKILIFCERIRQAEIIYHEISKKITSRVSIFHSELSKEVQKNALNNFKDGESRILVSCRALDEGIDVPGCDVGIIMSSSSSMRQHIQRLGRMLRTSPDKLMASVYYLYAKDRENSSYLPDNPMNYMQCDLKYLHEENDFVNPRLEELIEQILNEKRNTMNQPQLKELRKCLLEVFLRADYMLDETIILDKMSNTSNRHLKNYWFACLLLHQKWFDR